MHIYTGGGKGKSTAAFGLAVRAAGAGLRVCIHQFIKAGRCAEKDLLKNIKNIIIKRCGNGRFIKGSANAKDIECAKKGFEEARKDILSGKYDLIILDEVNIALKLGLIKIDEVIELIRHRPRCVELVLTGRCCPKKLLRYADVVTEMRKIKHPFDKGILARKGIEY
ncbi:MAG: cob(I)yrinic acid a,c-diamide adenosyltransferase [Candidatus Omnitrophica bacterium]|nr:cob(I)yrinic acid a,c-diamide adenosyltransferase [Candidatus Omnitrophota bacterium]MCM8790139.1 cob(I)yrinic acid a,c-diamide adenosyltransferase [Candidatus Omnitrophota bacterium]